MASNSGWSKGLPSGSSALQLGDNDIRSNQSVQQAAWEEEHYLTDGSTNSAGVHKLGSARAYTMASASELSNPTGDGSGRLAMLGSQLWGADGSNSTWTLLSASVKTNVGNTWSSTQTFVNPAFSPAGGGWNISGLTSGLTVLASTVTAAAGATAEFAIAASGLTFGDPVLVGIADDDPGSPDIMATGQITSNGSVYVQLYNTSVVDRALLSGSTVRFIGFLST